MTIGIDAALKRKYDDWYFRRSEWWREAAREKLQREEGEE